MQIGVQVFLLVCFVFLFFRASHQLLSLEGKHFPVAVIVLHMERERDHAQPSGMIGVVEFATFHCLKVCTFFFLSLLLESMNHQRLVRQFSLLPKSSDIGDVHYLMDMFNHTNWFVVCRFKKALHNCSQNLAWPEAFEVQEQITEKQQPSCQEEKPQ